MTARLDAIALGEIMLRLDPLDSRIAQAKSFAVRIGGGEFNMIAGLSSCFHLKTGVVTAVPSNDVGDLVLTNIRTAGVDTSLVLRRDDDGIGGMARVGINFTERGFGARAGLGISDRAGSAPARMQIGDIDWDDVFSATQPRLFHTGGVFTALSPETAHLALEAVRIAKRHGALVSYDVNFRPSLWAALNDQRQHAETIRELLTNVDILISNEPEYMLSIGETTTARGNTSATPFERLIDDVKERFPNIGIVAATQRVVHSASRNDWGAIGWSDGTGIIATGMMRNIEILDRIGGGDSFVSGLAFGILDGQSLKDSLALGVAHGALAMSTPGDLSMAKREEVEALAAGHAPVTRR
jgi:2-dehydro-3-deoxygluconokinase